MKEPLKASKRKDFKLNFLFVGDSGSGKTHFLSTYTKGPIHIYNADKGGKNTVLKVLSKQKRENSNQLSFDDFSKTVVKFSDFWAQFAKDEKVGLFDYLAENNGIAAFESLTTLNLKAIEEIGIVNQRTGSAIGKKGDQTKAFRIQDWGQVLQWIKTLVTAIQDLPCATVSTVHLHTIMDGEQSVVARYPSVNGQFRQLIGVDYDEVYLLESKKNDNIVYFKERLKFKAKSRVFSIEKKKNITMDNIFDSYMAYDEEITK